MPSRRVGPEQRLAESAPGGASSSAAAVKSAGFVSSLSGDEEEEVLSRLRSAGDRVTTPRRLLVRCLLEASWHRTAEEIAVEIQARAPDISISTVYRNLEELERLGVVVHSHLGHGPRPITSRPRRTATWSVESVRSRSRLRTGSSPTFGDGPSPTSGSPSTHDISR